MNLPLVVFVGQAPSLKSDPAEPLSGNSGRRLAAILGIPWPRFLLCCRRNVNGRYPGKRGRGDGFDLLEGREQARKLREALLPGDLIVLLGVNVANAFEVPYPGRILRFQPAPGVSGLVLPHPSGLNRFWNDQENRIAAREIFAASTNKL